MSKQISSSVPYAWPHDSSLSPSTTALLIIDMQRDFLSVGGYLDSQGYSPVRFHSRYKVIPKNSALELFINYVAVSKCRNSLEL